MSFDYAFLLLWLIVVRALYLFPEKPLDGEASFRKTSWELLGVAAAFLLMPAWLQGELPRRFPTEFIGALVTAAIIVFLSNGVTTALTRRGEAGFAHLGHFLVFIATAAALWSLHLFFELRPGSFPAGQILAGFAFCFNEANLLFRALIERLNIRANPPRPFFSWEPPPRGGTDAERAAYNRGRLIGMLERALIYLFVVEGAYTAIGFVLTLKAAIRFKELGNKEFAEYVLIGTLLSTLLALAAAAWFASSLL